MSASLYHWIGFLLLVGLLLGVDLIRAYRNPHRIEVKEALIHSAGWIFLAFLFNGWVYWTFGAEPALEFLTGYLIEESLSIDNLFIFILIFKHFQVPEESKYSILFYGILGAIVMRALFIWGGITLITHFTWIFIPFGLFLIFTGIRLAFKKESEDKIENGTIYRWITSKIPMTTYHGNRFFVRSGSKLMFTPLFSVLILIEITDLIFALDSIPAILGITTNPFIVFSSNIFAILGLRSLFFALEGVMNAFHFLHYALAFILIFIGCKMVIIDYYHVPLPITFLVIISSIILAIIASLFFPLPRQPEKK